jgi:hypothetical protein
MSYKSLGNYTNKLTSELILSTLNDIPPDLSDIWALQCDEVMKEDGSYSALFATCLDWVLFSERPLTAEELCSTFAGTEELPNSQRTVLLALKGFIRFESTKDGEMARLGHRSMREFFLNENLHLVSKVSWRTPPLFKMLESNVTIVRRCMECLLSQNTENISSDTLTKCPLLQYSATNWFQHFRHIKSDVLSNGIFELCMKLFNPASPLPFLNWLRVFDPFDPQRGPYFSAELQDFRHQDDYIRSCFG